MLKNKRTLLVAFAIVFLVVLFLIKNTPIFKNKQSYQATNQIPGLAYDATIGDLVEKDADLDGVPDWQEPLYGLDPTKKETTPGIPDSTVINKIKNGEDGGAAIASGNNAENLTETDKFSRELFSTASTLTQNGLLDQASADQIGASLASRIQNTVPEKIYTFSDIKVVGSSALSEKKYKDNLFKTYLEYPIQSKIEDVSSALSANDESTVPKINQVVKKDQDILNKLIGMEVPEKLAQLHLNIINAMEILLQDEKNMIFFESDPIIAIGALVNYENNLLPYQKSIEAVVDMNDKEL